MNVEDFKLTIHESYPHLYEMLFDYLGRSNSDVKFYHDFKFIFNFDATKYAKNDLHDTFRDDFLVYLGKNANTKSDDWIANCEFLIL